MSILLISSLLIAGSRAIDFPITDLPIHAVTSDAYACLDVSSRIAYCTDRVPNYTLRAGETPFASCLCCVSSSTAWLDGNAATCASYLHTAYPQSTSLYSAYSTLQHACAAEGNVCGLGTATGTLATTAGTAIPPACSSVNAILSRCDRATPGILSMPDKSQAGCFCFTTSGSYTDWAPETFQNYASSCANWASVSDKSQYAELTDFAALCSAQKSITSTGAPKSTAASGTAKSTSAQTVQKTTSTPSATTGGATTGTAAGSTSAAPTAVTVTVTNPATTSATRNAASGIRTMPYWVAMSVAGMAAWFSLV